MACQYVFKDKVYSEKGILEAIQSGNITLGNIDIARQNLRDLLGMSDEDIELVAGLINNRAVGLFREDGTILLSDRFVQGDEYHEAFHRVFRMMLSDKQRKALLKEYKGREGYAESLNAKRKLYPGKDNDTLVEELLADEFMMYQLSNGNYVVPKPVMNFFQRMLAFIRKMLGLQDIEGVYQLIRQGAFKTADVKSYAKEAAESRIELPGKTFTVDQKNEIVEAITAVMLNDMFDVIAEKASLEDVDPQPYFKKAVEDVLDELAMRDDMSDYFALNKDVFIITRDGKQPNPDSQLVRELQRRLRTLIKFDVEHMVEEKKVGEEDIPYESKEDEEDANNMAGDYAFMKASWEEDPMTNITKSMKLLATSLLHTETSKSYGLPKLVPYNQVVFTLFKVLKDAPQNWNTIEGLLQQHSAAHPWMNKILERLGTKDGVVASDALVSLRNQFITSLNKTHYNMYKVEYSNDNILQLPLDDETLYKTQIIDFKNRLYQYEYAENLLAKLNDSKTVMQSFEILTGIEIPASIINYEVAGKPIRTYIKDIETEVITNLQSNKDLGRVFDSKVMAMSRTGERDVAILGSLRAVLSVVNKAMPSYQGILINHNSDRVYPFTLTTYQKQIEAALNFVMSEMTPAELYAYDNFISSTGVTEKTFNGLTPTQKSIHRRIAMLEETAPYLVQDQFNFYKGNDGVWRTNSYILTRMFESDSKYSVSLFVGTSFTEGTDAKKLLDADMIPVMIQSALSPYGGTKYISLKHGDRGAIFAGGLEVGDDYLELYNDNNVNEGVNYLAGMLFDELRVWKDRDKYKVFKNMGSEDLRLFGFLGNIDKEKASKMTVQELTNKYGTQLRKHVESIQAEFRKYVSDTYGSLTYGDYIPLYMAKETYERLTSGLTAEAKRKKLDEALNTVALKYMVHYYEDMRLFTGYAGQYPDMANFFKRIQSLSSSGTPLVNDVDTNQAVIRANKKDRFVINGVEKTYGDDSLKLKGIIKEKPLVGPVVSLTDAEKQVLKDIYVNGLVNQDRVPADIANQRAEEWTSAFEEYEEADGATYTNMFFFREYKDRLGQWSQGQENTFQVELAILNQNTLNPTVYVSEDLKVSARPETGYQMVKLFDFEDTVNQTRQVFNTLEPMTMLKPIYAGPVTHQEVTVNGIRKTSFHLITPSMAIGTGKLKEIHDYMLLNDTDIVPLDSATKKAVPINIENIDSFGNEENGFSYLMVEFLKEQVPVSNKEKGRIKNATQSTTIMLSNLYINGVPKDYAGEDFDALSEEEKVKQSNIYKNVKAYRDSLYTVIDQSIDNVRNALGIDETEKITKVERIKSALTEQVTQPNLLDAIQQFEETITHLDLLPGFSRLEPVAFSLISNEAIRIKRPGEMAAQYSVYGFSNEDVAGQRSKRLNTYRLSEGKVLPAEVIVPLPMSMVDTLLQITGTNRLNKAIEKYNKGENKIIIKGLRIPNQQLSFNGIYAIKEFALPTMQNYIVLPSEIVPISSSDFDIDKQQLYLPILDGKGKLSKDKRHKAYNDLLQSEIDLLLMTENLHTLLAPVNESWLSVDLFVDVLTAKSMFKGDKDSKKDREDATIPLKFQDFGNITKQIQNGVNMAQSKINVGLVANNAKQYPIGMLDKWNATPIVIVDDRNVANKLPFAQDLKHYYAMYDSKYRHVVETISTILTSQVDGVKNPYAVLMNIGQRTIGPLMLMVRRGVDADLAIKMLSSPLIEKYTKAQDLFDSTLAKSRGLKKNNENIFNRFLKESEKRTVDTFISLAERSSLDISEKEINQALTESTTEAAYKVLAAYIYTETLADEQLSVTTAATPDTKPARNAEMLDVFNERMLDLTESSMIDKNLKQGFLSKFYEVQGLYDYLYQFYFMRNNAIGSAVATQLAPAIAARIYGNDRKVKAMRTIVSDFKSFMLIKAFMKEDATLYSFNNLVLGDSLIKEIDKLLKEGEPQMRDNYLLNQLQKVEIGQDPSNPENKLNLLQLKNRGSSSLYLYDVYDSFNDLPKSLQLKMIAYNTYVTGFMFSPFTLDDVINPAVSAEMQKKMLEPTQDDFNEFASMVAQLNPSLFYNKAWKGSKMAMKYNNYQLKDKELMSGGIKIAKLGNNYAKRYDGKGYTKIELEVSKPATATNVADVLKDECNTSGLKTK